MTEQGAKTQGFTISLVRWALLIRLLSLLLVLFLPLDTMQDTEVIIAVCLVAAWSLLWLSPRRRTLALVQQHPIIAVGDVLLAAVVTALVGVDSPLVFVTLSTALVIGLLLPSLAAGLICTILVASYLLVAIAEVEPGQGMFVFTLVLPATYAVLAGLGGVTRHLYDQVLAEQAKLHASMAENAATAERTRLARDMHDSVAKSLHGMALASATLPTWIDKDPATARRHAMAIQRGAEQASAEARSLLISLRQQPGNGELVEPLRALVKEFDAQRETAAELVVEKVPGLAPEACSEVVKAVAEALENVARHARATSVIVKLTGSMTTAQVEVIDDGVGFDVEDVPDGHFGIQGIRERMEAVSGELTLVSRPGRGTRLLLSIPLQDPPVPAATTAGPFTDPALTATDPAGQVR